ncbi:hypothetical protein OH791_33735 [Streptomyces anulatus]|uniref:hypothetical protein n=1 Tax=Streptomyces anulatus TaxID=1892 RepID=UPI0038645644|nr:hypothetical protein OH791_33735 [Streptomyces anulatus]
MTTYTPSPELAKALKSFTKTQEAADQARDALREAVANDLKAYDVTADAIAAHLPWSGETVRGIAREFGVPRKRKPTVRSINPKKRPVGGNTSG